MACVKFVKGLILDRLAFENFSLVTNQKFMLCTKLKGKYKKSYIVGLTSSYKTKTSFKF
jgi:hypothetical protein